MADAGRADADPVIDYAGNRSQSVSDHSNVRYRRRRRQGQAMADKATRFCCPFSAKFWVTSRQADVRPPLPAAVVANGGVSYTLPAQTQQQNRGLS